MFLLFLRFSLVSMFLVSIDRCLMVICNRKLVSCHRWKWERRKLIVRCCKEYLKKKKVGKGCIYILYSCTMLIIITFIESILVYILGIKQMLGGYWDKDTLLVEICTRINLQFRAEISNKYMRKSSARKLISCLNIKCIMIHLK